MFFLGLVAGVAAGYFVPKVWNKWATKVETAVEDVKKKL